MAFRVDAILYFTQQRRVAARAHLGVAELVHGARLDPATELRGHGLHAVADAEHRDPELEHGRGRRRRARLRYRLGTARQDDAARTKGAHRLAPHIPRMDLAVDAEFAHATRDQLRVLRAEVEDQDPVGVDVRWSDGRGLS